MSFALQAASIAGASLVLAAYAGVRRRWFSADSHVFDGLNAAGSGILLVVAAAQGNAGFMVLNLAWIVIGLTGIVSRARHR